MNHWSGVLAVFAAALLYGSYGIWSVLITAEFGIFFQSYARAIIVLLIAAPFVYFFVQWKRVVRGDYGIILLLTALGALTQAPVYYAYQNAGVGLASIFFFAAYLLAQYIVGITVFREKVTVVKVVSFALAIAGSYLIFANEIATFAVLAVLMAMLSGAASGAQVALTKLVSDKYHSMQISLYTWAGVVVTALPLSLLLGEAQHTPALTSHWFYLALFALAGLLTFVLVVYGYRYVDASLGGLIGLTEIVFAVLFGALFFAEVITLTIAIGAAIILFAAILPDLNKRFAFNRTGHSS